MHRMKIAREDDDIEGSAALSLSINPRELLLKLLKFS
jgi:hypothetical protein